MQEKFVCYWYSTNVMLCKFCIYMGKKKMAKTNPQKSSYERSSSVNQTGKTVKGL